MQKGTPGAQLDALPLAACAQSTSQNGKTALLAIVSKNGVAAKGAKNTGEKEKKVARPTQLVDLEIHRNLNDAWETLAELKDVALPPNARVSIAAVGQVVVLSITDSSGNLKELIAWQDGKWADLKIKKRLSRHRILAMLIANKKLVFVIAAKKDSAQRLQLATTNAAMNVVIYQPIMKEAKAVDWPTDELPLAAQLGKQVALLWRSGEELKLASCDLNGKLIPMPDVNIFLKPPSEGRSEAFHKQFMWGLMIAIFVVMFALRPKKAAVPFVLPKGMRVANFGKRILAAIIDFLPFSIISTAIFFPDLPSSYEGLKELMEQRPLPDALVYSHMLCIGLYTTYCIVMELRHGATLGKRIFKMRVVDNEGSQADLRAILLRNLARMILLSGGLPMLLLILFPILNRNRQRLGDMLAHTAVVDNRFQPLPTKPAEEQEETTSEDPDESADGGGEGKEDNPG